MINHLCPALFLTGLLLNFSAIAEDTVLKDTVFKDTGIENTGIENTGNENIGLKAAVAISLQNDQEIWTGQQVTLNLDLKTTGFSFSNSHFSLPEVSGAFLMQTDTTTIKLTEIINAQDWQIVRYLVVTTTSFELDHTWQPDSAITHTGDALTLTVTRRATGISAMLLPPLPVFRIDGLAAYPQSPLVSDRTNRGDLTGERTDSIIWVVEKPGTYEIPGIRFQWWDPLRQELKHQIIPGQHLEILSSAADGPVTGTAAKPERGPLNLLPWILVLLVGLFAGSLCLLRGRKTGDQSLINERTAFASLQKACKRNHAGQTHSAIYTWLSFCPLATTVNLRIVTLSEFARVCNDKKLASELEHLQNVLVSSNSSWRGSDLLSSLQAIRHKLNKQKKAHSRVRLGPLNP